MLSTLPSSAVPCSYFLYEFQYQDPDPSQSRYNRIANQQPDRIGYHIICFTRSPAGNKLDYLDQQREPDSPQKGHLFHNQRKEETDRDKQQDISPYFKIYETVAVHLPVRPERFQNQTCLFTGFPSQNGCGYGEKRARNQKSQTYLPPDDSTRDKKYQGNRIIDRRNMKIRW